MAWSTAQTLINRAAVQLGLATGPISTMTDPFASIDPNMIQLCDYLTSLGDDLTIYHNWPQLRRECVISTSPGTNFYNLPADFHEMIDQSGWNRSTRMPLAGPATVQEWQYLKSRAPSLLINVVFRLAGDVSNTVQTIEVNPNASPPTATIAFEYISTFWAMATGRGTPYAVTIASGSGFVWDTTGTSTTIALGDVITQGDTKAVVTDVTSLPLITVDRPGLLAGAATGSAPANKAAPDVGTDLVLYDTELVLAGLKLAWRADRGFDTVALQEVWERRLEHCIGKSVGAVTISMDGALRGVDRLIDDRNLPITGFGT